MLTEKERNIKLPEKEAEFYVEKEPDPDYKHASVEAHEAFRDIKFGVRIHWGIYSIWELQGESWPFLKMDYKKRQAYQELYKTWNPVGFNAEEWMQFFERAGFRCFAFTTKHHEGFCMFDTKTRVKRRVNYTGAEAVIEDCDLAYSIMETPFKRDVVKELCDAGHKHNMKIDLYFSHPDWYDADFRPYGHHPLISEESLEHPQDFELNILGMFSGSIMDVMPHPNVEEGNRMMARHRQQMTEILANYGKIDMCCLDIRLGPANWPYLKETIKLLRKAHPDVMFRNRGIGNYGDYHTPEGMVPGDRSNTNMPWMVIYPLGRSFSYEKDKEAHKGTAWVIQNLIDTVAKGGNFMVGIGPDGNGKFHPEAIQELEETGKWLQINGEGIYNTRPWIHWQEGDLFQTPEYVRCKTYPFKELTCDSSKFVRFTQSKDGRFVYIFFVQWPKNDFVTKCVKPIKAAQIELLGSSQSLSWRIENDHLMIDRSKASKPCDFAWCLKVPVKK